MELKQRNTKFLLIIFILIFIMVYKLSSGVLGLKSYNFMNKLTINNKLADKNIVLVVIDDKSLREIGRWPWKREYYLEIFDFFENHTKAKLIGYDGLITAPDTTEKKSDEKFFNDIEKYKKLTAGFAFSYDEFEKNIDKEKNKSLLKEKTAIKIIDRRTKKLEKTTDYKSFSALIEPYFKNINSLGFVNVPVDKDGYIRKASNLVNFENQFYPSLALRMYQKYTGIEEFILADKFLLGFSDNYSLKVPVENTSAMTLNYSCFYKSDDSIYSHKKYSAADIINSYRAIKKGQKPLINPQDFNNKVVFIGANANAQGLEDTGRTPISENFSGVDIQAVNFDNLVNNNYYRTASSSYTLLTTIFIFLLVFFIIGVFSIQQALLLSVIIGFLYGFFVYFMYTQKIALNLFLPELFILLAIGFAYSYRYLLENNKKRKIQTAMGKYLSQDVMQNVVENIDNIALGGKREDISVLFADIRNFTSIAESIDAECTTKILNEYFSALVPLIEQNNGILNKFMGDALLAIFGSSKKTENHALDAVQCADKMLKKVKYLQEKWIEEGKPKIEIGIGICSGEAFIGNIGSAERFEYTVIGDTVNTASRIESYNKIYRTNFLISESCYKRVEDLIDAIIIKDVVIRGKANKVNLYEVIRLK